MPNGARFSSSTDTIPPARCSASLGASTRKNFNASSTHSQSLEASKPWLSVRLRQANFVVNPSTSQEACAGHMSRIEGLRLLDELFRAAHLALTWIAMMHRASSKHMHRVHFSSLVLMRYPDNIQKAACLSCTLTSPQSTS